MSSNAKNFNLKNDFFNPTRPFHKEILLQTIYSELPNEDIIKTLNNLIISDMSFNDFQTLNTFVIVLLWRQEKEIIIKFFQNTLDFNLINKSRTTIENLSFAAKVYYLLGEAVKSREIYNILLSLIPDD